MEIIMQSVDALIPYENNPRKNEDAVDYVLKSIKEFGFKIPIVVDKNNVIVTGHTRLKAAIKLGLKEVPTIIADDLTEEQVNAYRLADNKVSEIAEWTYELLLEEIQGLDVDDLKLFDINDGEIEFADEEESSSESKPEEDCYFKCPNCQRLISKEELL